MTYQEKITPGKKTLEEIAIDLEALDIKPGEIWEHRKSTNLYRVKEVAKAVGEDLSTEYTITYVPHQIASSKQVPFSTSIERFLSKFEKKDHYSIVD